MTIMIYTVSSEEAQSLGIEKGDTGWGEKLKSFLVKKGFPESHLYKGSTQVAGFWDEDGNFYIAPSSRFGGIDFTVCPRSDVPKTLERLKHFLVDDGLDYLRRL